MRFLLSALILILAGSNILSMDLSLAPGLSVKNAMLYIGASLIVFRFIVTGKFRVEMGGFIACYVALIVYAIGAWLVAGIFVEYKGYSLLKSGISLKNNLVDPLIFFLTFLYGTRDSNDALKVLKVLLVAGVLLHVATLLDAFNIYSLGDYVEPGSNGRMAGPLGEANNYGDFIAMFLPPLCAAMALSRGFVRMLWLAGIALSMAALLTTASRGALIAILLSSLIGAYMLRRYLPAQKILPWLAKAVAVGAVVLLVVSIEFQQLLYDRIIGESKATGVGNLSSGRTEFWMEAINRMMAKPISLVTGFGWDTYGTMGFLFESHNQYLSLWFNLGLPGLILGTAVFVILLRRAHRAIGSADPQYQPYLMAFVFTVLATMIAVFLVELFTPWPYFWAYAGLAMRFAVDAQNKATIATPVAKPVGKTLTA
jgi:O-antigen ligase